MRGPTVVFTKKHIKGFWVDSPPPEVTKTTGSTLHRFWVPETSVTLSFGVGVRVPSYQKVPHWSSVTGYIVGNWRLLFSYTILRRTLGETERRVHERFTSIKEGGTPSSKVFWKHEDRSLLTWHT